MSGSRGRVFALAILLVLSAAFAARNGCFGSGAQPRLLDWPAISHQARPWTRWWWMGSALDADGITRELESLRAAGIGGVEITPIYGVAGAEPRFVPYLSDEWMRLLEHTLREARRLDLGVDMATGTGWPFGGPWVTEDDASRTLVSRTWTVDGGSTLADRVQAQQAPLVRTINNSFGDVLEQVHDAKPLPLETLIAYARTGEVIDLTTRVDASGQLDWIAPPGHWTLHGVFLGWHGKLVERAAPGGEGRVIDHFSPEAIRAYLARFDRAFASRDLSGLRAFFNDSYEVDDAQGQADGTLDLFNAFEQRRGYDLRRHLPLLFAGETREPHAGTSDEHARVLADYRLTISDLLLETFTSEWRAWAVRHGAVTRNQAHGSPANLLDLYAASDIPETEGTEFGRAKWASSAAHVAGRSLVSAETSTWLGEHFRSTLADVRADVDRFFLAGINHIVYHGTAHSPAAVPWPGWLFYASVEFNDRNPWWSDFPTLNAYVGRTQSFLQAGTPDHDVLLYYPFYDSLAFAGAERLTHFGRANQPLEGSVFEEASTILQQRGYTYDYISDRQLLGLEVAGGKLVTGGRASYKTLVIPASRFMPVETFERILELARAGATVIAYKRLADDVAGYAKLEERRREYRGLRDRLQFTGDAGVDSAAFGRGVVHTGDDLERLLTRAGLTRETLVDLGLQFVRRQRDKERSYFIANTNDRDVEGWIPFDESAMTAVVFDPMSGQRGDAPTRRTSSGTIEALLSVPRHSSLIVLTTSTGVGERFQLFETAGVPAEIGGPWEVRFVAGGPELPATRRLDRFASWTAFDDPAAKAFSGTALYTTTFRRPRESAQAWRLDLGSVRESARVRLNGRDIATLVGPDFRVTLEGTQLAETNTLEIHVTNLMANRIAALDRAGVVWRKFHNVNFPARFAENRGPDGLFTAAGWEPIESGLIGPVTVTPLKPRAEAP